MSGIYIKPQNLPEKLVWYYIIGTYPIYLLGAQFVLAPILVSFLIFYLLLKWWNQTEETPISEKITISLSVWVWVIAVLVIEFALIVAHINFNLGTFTLIKSSLLWYRTWGLFALFPLVGHLNIRPQLIYRAVCILCLQSLIVVLIGTIAESIVIPNIVYISPLKASGGMPIQYETQIFHGIQSRLKLFAVWPTFLALLGNIYFCMAMREKDKKWQFVGMFSSVFMIVVSQSRTATVGLPIVLVTVWFLTNCWRPKVQLATGLLAFPMGLFVQELINLIESFREQFDKFRAGSSKIRAIIYRMTLERWWYDAPIWGFGLRDEAPAIVVNLPLGTHNTWFGALYSHGLVGCVALAIAFLWSFIHLLIKAQTSDVAKVGLSIILLLFLGSLADNLEVFAYLLWPGLILLG
ncbi:MAG: O-antigen ligase family protein, partial [Pyrinomonadaceae bacterium]|nr:O-antigen ligase family protein [Pyrinomonadaceae bacterium]